MRGIERLTFRVVFNSFARSEMYHGTKSSRASGSAYYEEECTGSACTCVYVRTGVQHVRKRDRLPQRAARGPSFI